jgi:hypothetical protein
MSSNVVNQVAYLRTTREFPKDMDQLTVELNKSYLDIANNVNNRTISLFPTNRPAINGESWFINNNTKQQGLRQVYTFTTTVDIPIGFKLSKISQISKMYGMFTSGTATFGLIPGTTVAIGGQISFYVDVDATSTTSDLIKFVVDAAAPALTKGTIVLEWLSVP